MNPTPERTETPRTDAAKCRMNICMTSVELDAVSADFARTLETELNQALESAAFWEAECERERAQRQREVGAQEYRGNTVSYMYDKAKCYGDMVHGCSPALADAGFPPEEYAKDGQVGAIARAVADMAEEMSNVHAQNEALRGALRKIDDEIPEDPRTPLALRIRDIARDALTTTPPAKA